MVRSHGDGDDAGLSARDLVALDAAKLYYSQGLSQADVAERLHMSRPNVSKLLAAARSRGHVRTRVVDPRETDAELVARLKRRFDLQGVRLVVPVGRGPMDRRRALGASAADHLTAITSSSDIIGLWWSDTIQGLCESPGFHQILASAVVQLNGTDPGSDVPPALEAASRRSGRTIVPYAHPIVHASLADSRAAAERESDRAVLALRDGCDVAVFSAEIPSEADVLRSPAVSDDERELVHARATGHVCGRFIDAEGRIVAASLNQRTLGPTLSDLRRIRRTVLVAGGHQKLPIIGAALASDYATDLVTDVGTATSLLDE